MKKSILFILSCAIACASLAQEANFSVEISSDSVLMGHHLKVTFAIENGKANDFSAPEFEGFSVVSGPNMSSSFSMINGDVSQSVSYTYYLTPIEIGNYYIAPASVEVEDKILETQPLEVLVLPNPEGIQQGPMQEGSRRMDLFKDFPPFRDDTPLPAEKKKKKKEKKRAAVAFPVPGCFAG